MHLEPKFGPDLVIWVGEFDFMCFLDTYHMKNLSRGRVWWAMTSCDCGWVITIGIFRYSGPHH